MDSDVPASKSGIIRLWNVETATLERTVEPSGDVYSVAFSPDGKMLAAGLIPASNSDDLGQVRVWETKNWQPIAQLNIKEAHVGAIAWTPDGTHIAAACGDTRVRLWDWKRNHIVRVFQEPRCFLTSLAISPNGRFLATGMSQLATGINQGVKDWVQLWELSTGRVLHKWKDQRQVIFSPDSRVLATSSVEDPPVNGARPLVRLWDIPSGKVRQILPARRYEVPPNGEPAYETDQIASYLAFSPDGETLAVASELPTALWNWRQKKIIQILPVGLLGVLAFSPNGKLLAHTDNDGSSYLFDVKVP